MKRFSLILIVLSLFIQGLLIAQEKPIINIPDILGYKTLKCDFHMHTIFSDGRVWPTVRVSEAKQLGLDAIAITDHVEHRKFLDVIFSKPGDNGKPKVDVDRNMAYNIAKEAAEKSDIILIRGAEISRSMPPGHLNAIFLPDVNKVYTPEWKDAFREAKKQGAFIFWNHPGWKNQQPDTTLWWEGHTWLLENGMMHGIEVVNNKSYYPEAHQWAIEKNLTFMANTDQHSVVNVQSAIDGDLRTMTLVFAKERSVEGIKEALFDHRTLVYYDNKLIGNRKFLDAIFFNSISVESVEKVEDGFQIIINNPTDIPFELSKASGNDTELEFFSTLVLPARKQTTFKIYTHQFTSSNKIDLKLIVENLWMAPDKGLPVTLTFITK